MQIHKLTTKDLKNMSLMQLVSICRALDNSNGDWSNVKESEYEYVYETAWDLVAEYQSDYYN